MDNITIYSGMEALVRHCVSGSSAGRVLIIEPTLSHQECLPALIYYFNELGIGVDILLRTHARPERQILPTLINNPMTKDCDVNFFYSACESTMEVIASVLNKHPYDYIYFGTLYSYWIEDNFWQFMTMIKKVNKKCFVTVHDWEKMENCPISYDIVNNDCKFVLGKHVARAQNAPMVTSTIFFQNKSKACIEDKKCNLVVVGGFDIFRRDYGALLDAAIFIAEKNLNEKLRIHILGNSRPHALDFDHFKKNITRYGLDSIFKFTLRPSFTQIFSAMQESHYLPLLVNPRSIRSREYMKNKITGSINLAIGFGVVPIMDIRLAEAWGLCDYAATYDESAGLKGILAELIKAPERHTDLKKKLIEFDSENINKSLSDFKSRLRV